MYNSFREFVIRESCCGKKPCAKEFDDEKGVEEVSSENGFDFLVKVHVDGKNEDEAKSALKDALADFDGVKIKTAKSEKKEKKTDDEEPEDDDELEDDEEPAAKNICPECGKDFSHCRCR